MNIQEMFEKKRVKWREDRIEGSKKRRKQKGRIIHETTREK